MLLQGKGVCTCRVSFFFFSCVVYCAYHFAIRYYVSSAYPDVERNEAYAALDPAQAALVRIDVTQLQRNILADKPRVTRYPIEWDDVMPTENIAQNANTEANTGEAHAMEGGDVDMDMEDAAMQPAAMLPVPPAF